MNKTIEELHKLEIKLLESDSMMECYEDELRMKDRYIKYLQGIIERVTGYSINDLSEPALQARHEYEVIADMRKDFII